MVREWLIKPKLLVFLPLLLLLIIAVACGAEATPVPQPTATPQPVAPTATPQPILSPQDIASLVSEAVKGAVPPPAEVVSAAEIKSLVETAVAAAAPKGATAEDVKQLVEAGVAAVKAEAISKAEVAAQVTQAITEATAKLPKPVSAGEIEKIVKAAIPATPTPAPTATPAAALDPRALVAAARYGGVVPMSAFAEPNNHDPHQSRGNHDSHAISPAYNQLTEYNPIDGRQTEIVGDLAESWEVSDGGKTITFTLRQGVKWHDGKPFTVDDAFFSLNRMIEEGAVRPKTSLLNQYIDRIEQVDQNRVAVHLQFPSDAFMRVLVTDYMKIVPKHVLDAGVDINIFENAVGTGPFTPVQLVKGLSVEFTKNPNYFVEEQPFFDGIKGFFIADKSAEIAAFKTERVLMGMSGVSHLEVVDVLALRKDNDFMSRFTIRLVPSGAAQGFTVNVNVKPFDDPRVRKAFHLALHRQPIVEFTGKGQWFIGTPMFLSSQFALPLEEILTIPGYRELDGKKHPEDIAEAQRLLAEAGVTPGTKFTLKFPDTQHFPAMAILIKEQFKDVLGIDFEIRNLPVPTWFTEMIQGDFETGLTGVAPVILDPDDKFTLMYSDTSRNFSNHNDPEVIALLAKVRVETNFETRKALAYDMQRLVLHGSPATYELLSHPFQAPVSRRIHNYVPTPVLAIVQKHAHEWLEQR